MARFGTWNLENLFQVGAESGPATPQAYTAKLDALAATITEMEPDVLAVQEVGDPQALADLAARLPGAWHQVTADPDHRGIRVGFLSRTELTDVVQVSAFPAGLRPIQADDTDVTLQTMGRPALSARVHLAGGIAVDLVSCHLKSKLLAFPGGRFSTEDEDERARFGAYALYRRAAEAASVRAHVNRLLGGRGQERPVLVLGDFNDGPDAATTQILLGPTGSEIGTDWYGHPDPGDGARLWNLVARIPEANRSSRNHHDGRDPIDHILASQAIAGRVADGDIDFHDQPAPPVAATPAELRLPGSDHRPLLLLLDL